MTDSNDSPTLKKQTDPIRAETSSFDTDIRTELGQELRAIMLQKKMKQRELAELLSVRQPEISHLFNQHFNRFTIDKLIQFFDRLGWVVKFTIHRRENSTGESETVAPE